MIRIRIVGIGSHNGDDRIGWDAVAALETSGLPGRYPPGMVDVCRCEQPAGLLALLRGIDAAILVDALRSGAAPGTLRRLDAHALEGEADQVSSHGLSVAEYLALGRVLGMLPPFLVVYGIEAGQMLAGTAPDAALLVTTAQLADAIAQDLDRASHA
jgi:hydrogenase maturation protease